MGAGDVEHIAALLSPDLDGQGQKASRTTAVSVNEGLWQTFLADFVRIVLVPLLGRTTAFTFDQKCESGATSNGD